MKWITVSQAQLKAFVKEHNLTWHPNGMGAFWTDSEGKELARTEHGFVHDIFEIFTYENLETVMIVNNIFDKYAN
jgi:hypothetical protein